MATLPLIGKVPQRVLASVGAVLAVLVLAVWLLWPSPAGDPGENGAGETGTPAQTPDPAAVLPDEARPAFDLVRISRGGTGVIAGRMSPGAQVELFANGRKISEVTADANGEWVMILEEPLAAGSVELNLKGREGADAPEREAENVVVVSVPERESERFMDARENGVVAVLSPKDGDGGSRVLQKPGSAVIAEVGDSLAVDTLDYGAGTEVVVSGRAVARAQVRLYLDDAYQGEVRADDGGRWQLTLPTALAEGGHRLRVDQTLGDGKVLLRIEQPFETGRPLDPAEAEGGVLVMPGNTLWQIARQLYGTGVRYTLIFRENSEQIQDPDLIYPGQMFRLPDREAG